MLYRRKEDEMIHINLVGMGRFGKDTIERFRIDNLKCFGASKNGLIRMIVNENDVASICHIVYENKVYDNMDNLIPWNDEEIEAERTTKSLLILVGEDTDVSFKMFQMAAVSLLGNAEFKRIAFLHGEDSTLNNGLINQQIDHVFKCGSSGETAEMIRMFLESIYFDKYDVCASEWINTRQLFGRSKSIKLAYESALYNSRKEDEFDIRKLIIKTTEMLLKNINPFKKYIACILIEGNITLAALNIVMDAFRELTDNFQIEDEKLSIASHVDERMYNCMIFLYEIDESL